MTEGLFQELLQGWLAAFDLQIWLIPLVVTLLGAAVGAVAMLWGRSALDEQRALEEGRELDLIRRRQNVVEAVRALDLEKDKLSPEEYEAERRALLAMGAEALRAHEEGHVTEGEGTSELQAALERERERLGEVRYAVIQRVLRGEPVEAPAAGPRIGQRWQGALWTLGAVGVLMVLYVVLRGVEASQPPDMAQAPAAGPTAEPPEAVAAETRLRENPEDLDALNTLTDFAIRQQRWGDAAQYSRRALAVAPADPQARTWSALLDFRGGSVEEALASLDLVIAEHPDFAMALQYRGLIALRMGDFEIAIRSLEAALEHTEETEARLALRQILSEARAKQPVASEPEIHGTILLSEGIDPAAWGEKASVFVSVRAAEGPPMPLRAQKLPAGPFPLSFSLGPTDSPMGGGALPERVVVVVKVDLDGNPMGDDPGAPKVVIEGVEPSDTPLEIVLQPG